MRASSSYATDKWWGQWVQHGGRSPVLHRILRHDRAEWDKNEVWGGGESACGMVATFHVPGIVSRMGAPRCKKCCRKRGIPFGYGNPRNDESLPENMQREP